jgi:hypothetical protein
VLEDVGWVRIRCEGQFVPPAFRKGILIDIRIVASGMAQVLTHNCVLLLEFVGFLNHPDYNITIRDGLPEVMLCIRDDSLVL